MSATNTNENNELLNDESASPASEQSADTQEAGEQKPTDVGTTTETGEQTEFNAAELEEAFHLPPGSLKDVKDEASAYDAIRNFTDRTLVASLEHDPAADDVEDDAPVTLPKPAGKKDDTDAAVPSAVEARIAKLEAMEAKRETEVKKQQDSEWRRRALAEVDIWKSAKYGVSGSRNYNQTKALRSVLDMVLPHCAGCQQYGQPTGTIEAVMRRLRVFDGDVVKATKAADEKKDPLGTPGSRRDPGGKQPANIHEAYMNSTR